jgi:hypothetical protein
MSATRQLLFPFLVVIAAMPAAAMAQHPKPLTAPEAFTSPIEVKTAVTGVATYIRIQIDRYTVETERKVMEDALAHGGYPGFLAALRQAPVAGRVELGNEKFTIRWAREQQTDRKRTITVVTDAPIYFVGGGRADAKPRTGYELSVVGLVVDEFGMGLGKMSAAARVKPDGKGGVVIDDYADEPIKLTLVRREVK